MSSHKQIVIATATLLVVVLLIPTGVWACPNCKNSVAESSNAEAIGFAWSIALMLAMPFAIVTSWAIVIRRAITRGRI